MCCFCIEQNRIKGGVAKLKILQHSRIILFKLKFHHRTSCDWLNKSLINPHWAFCSKQIFEQCKKQVLCGTLLPAAISYPPHNHGGDCFPLRDLPCSLSRNIQRELLGDFKLQAGTAVPLPTFAENPQKFPQTPGASLIIVAASRNFSARFAGMYPANFFHMRSRR